MREGGVVPATSPVACVFCDIAAGRAAASVVYADDLVLAFMDIAQINPGHALVIPRAHYAALVDLPEALGAHLFTIAQRLAGVVRRAGVRCEGVNLFLSDGVAAGQEVFHCHLHVLPRFRGDAFRVESGAPKRPPRAALDAVAQDLAAAYREAFPAHAPAVDAPPPGRAPPRCLAWSVTGNFAVPRVAVHRGARSGRACCASRPPG